VTLWKDVVARRGYFAVAASVLVVDQATKIAAHAWLRGAGPVEIVPGLFNLWYSRNPGGLFGYFGQLPDPWRGVLLTAFPALAAIVIGVFLAKTDEPDRSTKVGLALILGGAVGNLIDRVFRGEVVDFLDVYASHAKLSSWLIGRFGTSHWPTFNVADSAIVIGAILLVLDILRPERPPEGVSEG